MKTAKEIYWEILQNLDLCDYLNERPKAKEEEVHKENVALIENLTEDFYKKALDDAILLLKKKENVEDASVFIDEYCLHCDRMMFMRCNNCGVCSGCCVCLYRHS